MAELDSLPTPRHKQTPQLGSSPPTPTRQKPHKPITSLLSKAAFFVLFAALLPLFPSPAPEFASQTLLTRSWELLHLLLVGIAVSYGLFSHRNANPAAEKEALHIPDTTPQSYLAQLLQVSPVFDDEEPEPTPCVPEENKLQMWNYCYQRGEPTVVVAPGSAGAGGGVGRRLHLPVRRLRSSVPGAESPGEEDELETPSPIPWRSRSGQMEADDEATTIASPPPHDASAFRSSSFCSPSSRPSSAASSPRRFSLSPSPSVSPEPRAKSTEDPGKMRILFKAPPAPPPPPPPLSVHKTPNPSPAEKEDCRSSREEPESTHGRNEDRAWSSDLGSPCCSGLRTWPRTRAEGYYSLGRSVRTFRPREVLQDAMDDRATLVTATSEKKKGVEDGSIIDSDSSDSDDTGEASDVGELPSEAGTGEEEEENEVDKKADEFIAKFREQIRLQRIESIRQTLRKP